MSGVKNNNDFYDQNISEESVPTEFIYKATYIVHKPAGFLQQESTLNMKGDQRLTNQTMAQICDNLKLGLFDLNVDEKKITDWKTKNVTRAQDDNCLYIFKFPSKLAFVSTLHFVDQKIVGATIDQEGKLSWFKDNSRKKDKTDIRVAPHQELEVAVRYPLVAYSGLTPDRREIIIANLADKDFPQHIIHLSHQMICFAGCPKNDRILIMELDDKKMAMSQIIKKFPFKKQTISNEIDYFEFSRDFGNSNSGATDQKGDITQFDLTEVQRAEYMNLKKEKLATVVVQTRDEIWSLSSKKVERISTLDYTADLPMQRGSENSIFWAEKQRKGFHCNFKAKGMGHKDSSLKYQVSASIVQFRLDDVWNEEPNSHSLKQKV